MGGGGHERTTPWLLVLYFPLKQQTHHLSYVVVPLVTDRPDRPLDVIRDLYRLLDNGVRPVVLYIGLDVTSTALSSLAQCPRRHVVLSTNCRFHSHITP